MGTVVLVQWIGGDGLPVATYSFTPRRLLVRYVLQPPAPMVVSGEINRQIDEEKEVIDQMKKEIGIKIIYFQMVYDDI